MRTTGPCARSRRERGARAARSVAPNPRPGPSPMTSLRFLSLRAAALASLLGVAACKDATGGGSENLDWDSPTAKAFLVRNFARIPRIIVAITRVLETANGQPQPGVTFVP